MKSKKVLIVTLISSFMIMATTFSASAATMYFKAGGASGQTQLTSTTPWYYPNEAYKASTNNTFGITLDASKMQYKPEIGINSTDVVFTISNGLFQAPASGKTYILMNSSTGIRAGSASGGSSENASPTPTTLTFSKVNLVAGNIYYISAGTTGTASTSGTLNLATANTATPSNISMSVAQGTTYNTATASNFVQFADYWTPVFATSQGALPADKANAIIDVAQARKKFTSGGTGYTTTTDTIVVTLNDPANATPAKTAVDSVGGVTLPGTAVVTGSGTSSPFSNFIFSLGVPDTTGISSVVFTFSGGTPQTLTYDATNKVYSYTVTTSGIPANGNTGTFVVTVDGNTVLNTRNFTMSMTATGQNGFNSKTYWSGQSAGSWGINGFQAYCPYVNTNTAYGTQFVLNNTASTAADVFWDTVSSSSATVQANLSNYSAKQVTGKTQIPANGTMVFNADEVIAALGLPTQEAGSYLRNQIRVTVTSSPSLVTGMAIQADGGTSKRSEPLLIDEGISGSSGYKTN